VPLRVSAQMDRIMQAERSGGGRTEGKEC